MKISEITIDEVKEYLKIDSDEEDSLINSILLAAKSYITSYTGQTMKFLDSKEEFIIVVYILCTEMYENRWFTVDNEKLNPIVKSILDMYSVNLL